MEAVLKKKINLLIHLANADGQFHATERAFLHELLSSQGIKEYELIHLNKDGNILDGADDIMEKEELLYWAFQLVRIDGQTHPDEIAYCKALAIKLHFAPDIVEHYKDIALPKFADFIKEAVKYRDKKI